MPDHPAAGHILAVDDCPVMREYVAGVLAAAGMTVRTACDGAQALELARHETFDAVVLDYDLPGMTGAEVGSALRGDPSTSACAIAMHTSKAEETIRDSGFGDFDAYVGKPCSSQSLGDTVARLVAIRRARG